MKARHPYRKRSARRPSGPCVPQEGQRRASGAIGRPHVVQGISVEDIAMGGEG